MDGIGLEQPILLNRVEGIARVVFNRPRARNALSIRMCEALFDFLTGLADDRSLRVLVISGSGADFSSGADVKELADLAAVTSERRSEEVGRQVHELSQPIFGALHRLEIPIVASVRGYAIGAGMQFALSADLVILSEPPGFRRPWSASVIRPITENHIRWSARSGSPVPLRF